MGSAAVLDFEQLTAPLAGDKPTGVDLRDDPSPDSLYHRLKDARAAARAAERQAAMSDSGEVDRQSADWRPVLTLGLQAIAEESKDLEVAAWLIEALVRQHGFAGLRDGFRLARELVESFWDDLFPLPDEDGWEARLYPLTGLNGEGSEGTLITPINNVPITTAGDAGPLTHANYLQALEVDRISDAQKRERRLSEGAISREMFDRAVAQTAPEHLRELHDDLQACTDEFRRLGAVLDEKVGQQSPPTSSIREALENVTTLVNSLAPSASTEETTASAAEATASAAAGTPASASLPCKPPGAIENREEALRVLLQVAEFFRRTEPHTPVSYALEQAVRWGRMSLPDLLAELITDDNVRSALYRQVGIPQTNQE